MATYVPEAMVRVVRVFPGGLENAALVFHLVCTPYASIQGKSTQAGDRARWYHYCVRGRARACSALFVRVWCIGGLAALFLAADKLLKLF